MAAQLLQTLDLRGLLESRPTAGMYDVARQDIGVLGASR